jgi:hypothetical protein
MNSLEEVTGNRHEVTIQLTLAEAVVLADFLTHYSETDRLLIEDQAEQRLLWDLQCCLERLICPGPPYPSLKDARESLRDQLD